MKQQDIRAEIILAVDNNDDLAARAREEFPDIVVEHNSSTRGAAHTRNVGVRRANSSILVFLDDDTSPSGGDWLRLLITPLQDATVLGVGGEVVARWPKGRPPTWFPEEFNWVVGASYTGLPTETAEVRNVWSENMAVRQADFNAVGGFDRHFGKVGDVSLPEDTAFCLAMSRRFPDGHWLYVPEASVEHWVPAERSTLAFFARRTAQEGSGKAALLLRSRGHSNLESESSFLLKVLPRSAARNLHSLIRGESGVSESYTPGAPP